MPQEITQLQKLAVAEALIKACKAMTNPHGGAHGAPNLRTDADDALRADYEREGIDRKRISVNGKEVGTLSARIGKPVDETVPEIYDMKQFVEWLRTSDGGLDALWRMASTIPGEVLKAATADGELPDGCRMARRVEPAKWLGTTLRVSPQKVAEAMGGELPEAVAGLIAEEV